MPNESLSVYLTAVDGMSPVLASITDKTRALDKESQELQQTYEALQKANSGLIQRKTELEQKLRAVNDEVKEAKKQLNELGDEASSDAFNKAVEKQQALKNEIAGTTKALQENQKMYKENIETIRKGGLEEQGSGLNGELTGNRIAMGLISGQVGQMLSSSVGGYAKYLAESTLGVPTAELLSSGLGNAISGALAGSVFGPWGALAGGILGLGSGLLSGQTKILEAEDDAFKDYYGGLYEDVKGRSGEMVEAGTSLASTRETNRISFTTLFDGDEDRARSYLEDLIDMANSTPFLYDDLVSMSKTLATYGYDDSNILPLLQTIGDAGAALGMGTSDMNSVAQALGRMKSSDKTTLEYLNMLNDRGIGAVGMLAEAKGVSQGDMYSMISKGQISGSEAVEIITAALEKSYSGSMLEQSKTFSGISSTLEGLQQNLNALGGEGYNTLRQEGKEAEVNSLKGDLGDAIGEINRIMGENQARRENLQDQYMREVKAMVTLGEKGELWDKLDVTQQNNLTEMSQRYADLMARYEESDRTDWEAGAELESLYELTEVLGQAYFDNSDEVARLSDIELDEIDAIQENTAGLTKATQASYNLSQALSKGQGNVFLKAIWGDGVMNGTGGDASHLTSSNGGHVTRAEEEQDYYITYSGLKVPRSHAFGLPRVPYDEYPALLHRDERVLTASEARAQDAGQGQPIKLTITGNNFAGMPEEMADQLFEIIVRKLERAYTAAAPK